MDGNNVTNNPLWSKFLSLSQNLMTQNSAFRTSLNPLQSSLETSEQGDLFQAQSLDQYLQTSPQGNFYSSSAAQSMLQARQAETSARNQFAESLTSTQLKIYGQIDILKSVSQEQSGATLASTQSQIQALQSQLNLTNSQSTLYQTYQDAQSNTNMAKNAFTESLQNTPALGLWDQEQALLSNAQSDKDQILASLTSDQVQNTLSRFTTNVSIQQVQDQLSGNSSASSIYTPQFNQSNPNPNTLTNYQDVDAILQQATGNTGPYTADQLTQAASATTNAPLKGVLTDLSSILSQNPGKSISQADIQKLANANGNDDWIAQDEISNFSKYGTQDPAVILGWKTIPTRSLSDIEAQVKGASYGWQNTYNGQAKNDQYVIKPGDTVNNLAQALISVFQFSPSDKNQLINIITGALTPASSDDNQSLSPQNGAVLNLGQIWKQFHVT